MSLPLTWKSLFRLRRPAFNNVLLLVLAVGYIAACATSADHRPEPLVKIPSHAPNVAPKAEATEKAVLKTADPMRAFWEFIGGIKDPGLRKTLTRIAENLDLAIGDVKVAAANTTKAAIAKDAEAKEAQERLIEANRSIGALNERNANLAGTIAELKQTVADVKAENQRIRRGDAKRTIQIGIGACFLAILLGAVLCKFDWTWGLLIAFGGAAGMACGILALSFSNFVQEHETAIGIGILVLFVVAVAGGLWFAYLRLRASTVAAAKIIQTGIVTGAVDFEKLAPIARTNETPLLAKIVNKHTSKEDREFAVAASDVNGPGNIAGAA